MPPEDENSMEPAGQRGRYSPDSVTDEATVVRSRVWVKVPFLAVKAGFSLDRALKMPTGPGILHCGEDSGATVQLNAFSPRHLRVHGPT